MRWPSGGESGGIGVECVGSCQMMRIVGASTTARSRGGSYGVLAKLMSGAHCPLTVGAKGGCGCAVRAGKPGPCTKEEEGHARTQGHADRAGPLDRESGEGEAGAR